jgi:hypothetical protein
VLELDHISPAEEEHRDNVYSRMIGLLNPDSRMLNILFLFDVVLTVHHRYYVEIKCQLDATDEFLLQILLLAQHVSGTKVPETC